VVSLLWKNYGFGHLIDKAFPENLGKAPIIVPGTTQKF
jgi:hypothetical protein